MSFFAIFLALLLEQARPLGPSSLPQQLSRAWIAQNLRSFDAGQQASAWLSWAFIALLPALLTTVLHHLLGWLDFWWAWVLQFLLHAAVLYLTLGFRQFSGHFSRIRQALDAEQLAQAQAELTAWAQLPSGSQNSISLQQTLQRSLGLGAYSAHLHVFGPLVAYLIGLLLGLGPAGALAYRLSEQVTRYCAANKGQESQQEEHPISPAMQQVAQQAWHYLDWLPARITALLFAIVGNFEEAIARWRECKAGDPNEDHSRLLVHAAAGALGLRLALERRASPSLQVPQNPQEGDPDLRLPQLAHSHTLIGLVWRAVVVCMTLLAFVSVATMGGGG